MSRIWHSLRRQQLGANSIRIREFLTHNYGMNHHCTIMGFLSKHPQIFVYNANVSAGCSIKGRGYFVEDSLSSRDDVYFIYLFIETYLYSVDIISGQAIFHMCPVVILLYENKLSII